MSEGFVRLDPDAGTGDIRLELDAVAHRFAAGNRIRLVIAGGSYPRWERNLGTDEDPATSTRMAPSHRTIDLRAVATDIAVCREWVLVAARHDPPHNPWAKPQIETDVPRPGVVPSRVSSPAFEQAAFDE